MGKIIAIANQKGGVGKTTTTINLGGCLGVLEYKTLIVDADPQANSTSGTGFDPKNVRNIYDCLVNGIHPKDVILNTSNPNLDVLPSHLDLVGAELEMINLPNREYLLKSTLEKVKDDYDFILIDCPPALSLLTLNALCCANGVVIPMQCEYYALEGLSDLVNTIKQVCKNLNPNLTIIGLLRVMYDPRMTLAQQVSAQLEKHFGNKVFKTIIPRNVRLAEAPSYGVPGVLFDKSSKGAKAYLDFANEMVERLGLPIAA